MGKMLHWAIQLKKGMDLEQSCNIRLNAVGRQTFQQFTSIIEPALFEQNGGTWFFQSDTGTSKTRSYCRYVSDYVRVYHEGRVFSSCGMRKRRFAIAVPTMELAQEVFGLIHGVIPEHVAVWTGDHEAGCYGPEAQFTKGSLKNYDIVIGTHAFLMSNRHDPRRHVGDDIDVLIVDETPANLETNYLRASSFAIAAEAAVRGNLRSTQHLRHLEEWARGHQERAENFQPQANIGTLNVPLDGLGALNQDFQEQPEAYWAGAQEVHICNIRSFLQAAQVNQAAGHLATPFGGAEFRFMYYRGFDRWWPKRVVVSATVFMDGFQFSPHYKGSNQKTGIKVDCSKISVKEYPYPTGLGRTGTEIERNGRYVDLFMNHATQMVQQTPKNSKVLVVGPKGLLTESRQNFKRHWEQLPGGERGNRTLDYINWGAGVGMNKWSDFTEVVILSELIKPSSIYFCEMQIFSEDKFDPDTIAEIKDGQLTGRYIDLKASQKWGQFKQMAFRGSARIIDDEGKAAPMTLWVSQKDFNKNMLDIVLPNCSYELLPNINEIQRERSARAPVITRVINALDQLQSENPNQESFEAPELIAVDGTLTTLRRSIGNLSEGGRDEPTLRSFGWRVVRPGRPHPNRFEKIAA